MRKAIPPPGPPRFAPHGASSLCAAPSPAGATRLFPILAARTPSAARPSSPPSWPPPASCTRGPRRGRGISSGALIPLPPAPLGFQFFTQPLAGLPPPGRKSIPAPTARSSLFSLPPCSRGEGGSPIVGRGAVCRSCGDLGGGRRGRGRRRGLRCGAGPGHCSGTSSSVPVGLCSGRSLFRGTNSAMCVCTAQALRWGRRPGGFQTPPPPGCPSPRTSPTGEVCSQEMEKWARK